MIQKLKIKKGRKEDFRQVYADMLAQFPESEMKPKEAFERLLENENYDFCVIVDSRENMVSYFLCYKIPTLKMGLLDHFAVVRQCHGRGVGSAAIALMRNYYSDLKGLILEVEPPDCANPDTVRRIAFYERCGAYKIDMKYSLPTPQAGAIPMNLMFLNCGSCAERVEKRELRAALKVVFANLHSAFANSREVFEALENCWSNGL